jgi:NAD(P)-dependent dehydrogenase (short-subunit alcohol dehydrogenase family)
MANMKMQGKVYVVTGGGSGSGRSIAKQILAAGGAAVIWGRTATKLNDAIAAGDATASMVVDVTDPDAVVRAYQAVMDQFRRLDGLVHCAGIWTAGKLADIPASTAVTHINNVTIGAVLCVQGALKVMAGGEGRIVQIAAASGKPGFSETALNMLAKRAQDGLQEGLATELKGSGIRLSTIFPDNIGRPGSEKVIAGKAMSYDDVAGAVMWILQSPPTTWVQEILMTSPMNPRLG